jgi:phosphate transport system protein
MSVHLETQTNKLKNSILALSAIVEDMVHRAVKAVIERDPDLAREVIDGDPEVDRMEVEIEEECLKLLALYQPVATDLREVVAMLKINNDLERIADLAVNIGERAIELAASEPEVIPYNLRSMADSAMDMLRNCLDSLVRMDPVLAREVCKTDEVVDEMNRKAAEKTKVVIREAPEKLEQMLNLMLVARHLERVADLSTNIAEDVIYSCQGVIVRHNDELDPKNKR